MARYNLELSEKEMDKLCDTHKGHYVDESELTENHLLVMGKSMDCHNCGKIPIELFQCKNCTEIHCCHCAEEKVKCKGCKKNEYIPLDNK